MSTNLANVATRSGGRRVREQRCGRFCRRRRCVRRLRRRRFRIGGGQRRGGDRCFFDRRRGAEQVGRRLHRRFLPRTRALGRLGSRNVGQRVEVIVDRVFGEGRQWRGVAVRRAEHPADFAQHAVQILAAIDAWRQRRQGRRRICAACRRRRGRWRRGVCGRGRGGVRSFRSHRGSTRRLRPRAAGSQRRFRIGSVRSTWRAVVAPLPEKASARSLAIARDRLHRGAPVERNAS